MITLANIIIILLTICSLALVFYVGKCFIEAFRAEWLGRPSTTSLDEKLDAASETRWTRDQLNTWLDNLNEDVRNQVLAAAKKGINRGGDPVELLCQIRAKVEPRLPTKRSFWRTLLDLSWEWDVAMKMGEERRFYQEQHKKFEREEEDRRRRG